MKIERLDAVGYQGLNHLALDIERPIVLVAGHNATGKSSIRDAIQYAMTGVSGRVRLKKDYDQLVRIGSDPKNALVALSVDGFVFKRKVATGAAGHEERDYPLVLPHLLGSTRFALLDTKEQSRLLQIVTGVQRDAKAVANLLAKRGITPECIELAAAMTRAGFPAAEKACKEKQSEARGAWEAIAEERFGEAKAVNWKATPPPTGTLKNLVAAREGLQAAIPELEQEIAGLEAQKVAIVQHTHSSGVKYACPCCSEVLIILKGKLVKDERSAVPEPPQAEQATLIESVNGKRRELADLQQNLATTNLLIHQAENAEKLCAERTTKAAAYFARYLDWQKAAAAMSETGIPLALLESGLKPINERLAATSAATGWKPIVIRADLNITYGDISYALCSESEQWRVDAAIVEALALLSNVKLFILDRMDVLHPSERANLLRWLLAVAPQHDTIVILATLKEKPAKLPEQIQLVWLDAGGNASALEKAA